MVKNSETWKAVVGFEGIYEVSDHGRVRRVAPSVNGHQPGLKKLFTEDRGYKQTALYDRGRMRQVMVHVLVLEAFIGPRPPGMQGCHYDDNPSNNHLSNLRWDTPSANGYDRARNNPDTEWSSEKLPTHCPNGHEYPPGARDNLDASRAVCRICLWDRRDKARKGRPRTKGPRSTECIHGHPRTPENSYIAPDGKRRCRECMRNAKKRRREAAKASRGHKHGKKF